MVVTVIELVDVMKRADIIGLDPESLKPDELLSNQGVDSLDLMAYFLHVEDEYDLKIPDSDLPELTTLDGITVYLNHRLNDT